MVVTESDLPASFDGFRIAQVSDLHNSWRWKQVIAQLQRSQPDMICMTGDLVDSRRTNTDTALAFAEEAVKIAPCYYIPGNHEARLDPAFYQDFILALSELGVYVIQDNVAILEREGDRIDLIGHGWGDLRQLQALSDPSDYRILLSHDPVRFDEFVALEYDLVLSGHVHGGQFRLPFLGGLYAPSQGLLPEYDGGLYSRDRTDMIISRGVGNSTFPIRFHNRPEVVLVVLERETHT